MPPSLKPPLLRFEKAALRVQASEPRQLCPRLVWLRDWRKHWNPKCWRSELRCRGKWRAKEQLTRETAPRVPPNHWDPNVHRWSQKTHLRKATDATVLNHLKLVGADLLLHKEQRKKHTAQLPQRVQSSFTIPPSSRKNRDHPWTVRFQPSPSDTEQL